MYGHIYIYIYIYIPISMSVHTCLCSDNVFHYLLSFWSTMLSNFPFVASIWAMRLLDMVIFSPTTWLVFGILYCIIPFQCMSQDNGNYLMLPISSLNYIQQIILDYMVPAKNDPRPIFTYIFILYLILYLFTYLFYILFHILLPFYFGLSTWFLHAAFFH